MKGPWFEEEPSDTLIVNQPVSLKCKVHDVLSAQFHCNHGKSIITIKVNHQQSTAI